ncbi:MAG: hypothetical protein KF889_22530 [Alphaproteobacteria bacterium]|nr:hypothetical protein [Alphaproteobacteria bacterium]MCW5744414.1 hypothetical protein [Alphaproteobacteria bacterium]
MLDRVGLIELIPSVLARVLDPFPVPVRTLHGLYLASMAHLRGRSQSVELASYDERLLAAAAAMGIPRLAL